MSAPTRLHTLVQRSRTAWLGMVFLSGAAVMASACAAPEPEDDDGSASTEAALSGSSNIAGLPEDEPFVQVGTPTSFALYFVTMNEYCVIERATMPSFLARAEKLKLLRRVGTIQEARKTVFQDKKFAPGNWCKNLKLPVINTFGAPAALPLAQGNPYQPSRSLDRLWYLTEESYEGSSTYTTGYTPTRSYCSIQISDRKCTNVPGRAPEYECEDVPKPEAKKFIDDMKAKGKFRPVLTSTLNAWTSGDDWSPGFVRSHLYINRGECKLSSYDDLAKFIVDTTGPVTARGSKPWIAPTMTLTPNPRDVCGPLKDGRYRVSSYTPMIVVNGKYCWSQRETLSPSVGGTERSDFEKAHPKLTECQFDRYQDMVKFTGAPCKI